MTLMRRNPYDPIYDIDQTMRRMMDRMRTMMTSAFVPEDDPLLIPGDAEPLAIDMTSDKDHVIVRTALPGFTDDEIDVDVQGNVLTITAKSKQQREDHGANWHIRELRYGKFARSVMLPEDVIPDKADAALENGILTVKLPKRTPSPIQKIAVKARNLLKPGKQAG